MTVAALCREICNIPVPTPLPPPAPGWGGGTTPIDPTILAVTCPTIPSTAVVNVATTIRVIGQNFTASCQAFLDNVGQVTTFVSATELTFSATGTVAKTSTITVKDGATVATGTCQFVWTAAQILTVICPVNPINVMVGTAALEVTVNGTLFTNTCEVLLDGTPVPTTYISPTQLRGTIDPTLETPRIAAIGVRETATGVQAVMTCPFEFLLATLTPTLTYISPDFVGKYDVGKTVTYTGTNFDPTSVILRGAIGAIPTTYVSPTELRTTTTAATATVAMFEMRVRNGPPGGPFKLSNNLQATCTWNPGLNMLVPATAPIAGGPVMVQVLGTNFGYGATVMVDNVAQPTVPQSGGWLDVTLTPPAAPGVVQIDVRLGHDHPEGHDNVRPSAANTAYPGPTTLAFTWT